AISIPHREIPITFLCGHTFHKGRTYDDGLVLVIMQVVPSASIISLPGPVYVPPYPNGNAPVPCKLCRDNKVWDYDWSMRV
ncbi:hypothetical protein QBC32DRAFT_213459, partial [Pseudoneurospora amorphoporcata]